MSHQKAYMCNVLEFIRNVNIKTRAARERFGATLKLYRYILLLFLVCLYGKIKKRLAR